MASSVEGAVTAVKLKTDIVSLPPPNRLRGSSSSLDDHDHRELHGDYSIFDNPGSSHSQIDNSVINEYSEQLQQQQTQLQRHPASWGTLASFFLLTQGIVILCTVVILIYCVRKHRHQRIRQRLASIAQIQGRPATMRTNPSEAARIDTESGANAGRSSGLGNAVADAVRGSGAGGANDNSSSNSTGGQICPRPLDAFFSMSRTFGSALLRPFRALRTAVNNWATGDYDEVFLRQLMERMEAEREAAKENPNERARRLKEAFAKAGTVWILTDEHFLPPTMVGSDMNSMNLLPSKEGEPDIGVGTTAEGVSESCSFDETVKGTVDEQHEHGISTCTRHGRATATNANVDSMESCLDRLGINELTSCQIVDDSNDPGPTVSAIDVETQPVSVDTQSDILPGRTFRADFLEPNQMYIYLNRSVHDTQLSVNAESMQCTPNTVRFIPNQCAICLCDYEKGDTIVTSCSGQCPHAFHQNCVVEWLVKMQEDTPCPCCRRSFVYLNSLNHWHYNNLFSTTSNNANNASQDRNNVSNLHSGSRRWRISFWGQSTNNNSLEFVEEITEAERLRQEWVRRIIEQELRRRRAFNASVISLR